MLKPVFISLKLKKNSSACARNMLSQHKRPINSRGLEGAVGWEKTNQRVTSQMKSKFEPDTETDLDLDTETDLDTEVDPNLEP